MINIEIGNWNEFKNELSSRDNELLRYPQRAFQFINSNFILINQSTNSVATIVWDSEVILSHYLDNLNYNYINNKIILELGAGTSLASIVISKLNGISYIQDLNEIIDECKERLIQNNILTAKYISGRWGNELVLKIMEETNNNYFDMIVMSDVLYQPEHFTDLNNVIKNCSKIGTELIIAYELRRLDLKTYFSTLSENFETVKVICYEVPKQFDNDNDNDDYYNDNYNDNNLPSSSTNHHTITTTFYLHHLRRIV